MKKRIFEITGVNVYDMDTMEIVEEVILPKILRPTGQDIRGWRIGDDFMNLMADFGYELYRMDSYRGEILLEIAMQRISCGAVLHEPTPITLPVGYEKYSVACDQYGLMSKGCWNFIEKQADTCLVISLIRNHMKKILFGLVDNLTPSGANLNGFTLGSGIFNTSGKEVYDFSLKTLERHVPKIELIEHFATPERWMQNKHFFKENWDLINEKDFFKRIGKTGFFEKRKIRKEILG